MLSLIIFQSLKTAEFFWSLLLPVSTITLSL
nr:MAG TPA: hypothetical protein [Caudoviricetes sp.]